MPICFKSPPLGTDVKSLAEESIVPLSSLVPKIPRESKAPLHTFLRSWWSRTFIPSDVHVCILWEEDEHLPGAFVQGLDLAFGVILKLPYGDVKLVRILFTRTHAHFMRHIDPQTKIPPPKLLEAETALALEVWGNCKKRSMLL